MRLLRNLAIMIVSLLVFFGLAEVAARALGVVPRRVRAPMFSWVERGELYTMVPGRRWVMPRNQALVRVNSLGLRGPEIGPKNDQPRVLVLGDSVAFGYEVPEKRAFPADLQRDLRSRGIPAEVIGAAVPGWCARQHRLFLERDGPALAPDVVVATVVLNDIPELQKGRAELAASVGIANTLNWLAERSALATAVRDGLASTDNPFAHPASVRQLAVEPDADASRRGMELERRELQGILDEARALNAPVGLVILPFRFQLDTPGSDAPQRAITEFAEAQGIPVLDLLPALRGHEPGTIFLDQVHLSETGNQIVASDVAQWLQREGLLRYP